MVASAPCRRQALILAALLVVAWGVEEAGCVVRIGGEQAVLAGGSSEEPDSRELDAEALASQALAADAALEAVLYDMEPPEPPSGPVAFRLASKHLVGAEPGAKEHKSALVNPDFEKHRPTAVRHFVAASLCCSYLCFALWLCHALFHQMKKHASAEVEPLFTTLVQELAGFGMTALICMFLIRSGVIFQLGEFLLPNEEHGHTFAELLEDIDVQFFITGMLFCAVCGWRLYQIDSGDNRLFERYEVPPNAPAPARVRTPARPCGPYTHGTPATPPRPAPHPRPPPRASETVLGFDD